jgi:CubicO group peptidase (beta-lactamase class C family)
MSSRPWRPPRGPVLAAAVLLAVVLAVALGRLSTLPRLERPTTAATPLGRHHVDPGLGKQIEGLFEGSYTDAFRNRRAFLVSLDGELVVEQYHKSARDTTVNVQSVGTSVMSTLIGIALDEGRLRSVDQTLAGLLPSYRDDMAPQVKGITLRQLLTMTAGLPADEEFYPKVWGTSHDWVRGLLADRPTQPSGSFLYSSAGSHLLSVILEEATGRSVLQYAREKLFTPLEIDTTPAAEPAAMPGNLPEYRRARFAWPTDPQGHHIGGGGLKLTARDLAKLGQLWLHDGRWGDRQLVSATWMKDATTALVTAGEFDYGYHIWVTEAADHDAFAAVGAGGQLIEVVPDLGLVVVALSTSPSDPTVGPDPGTADSFTYAEIVEHLVVPAIRR